MIILIVVRCGWNQTQQEKETTMKVESEKPQ